MKPTPDFINAMNVDLAISQRQAKEWYGITPRTTLLGCSWVKVWVASHRGAAFLERFFLVVDGTTYDPNQLRHLAGTAELRHRLQATPESWNNLAFRVGDVRHPDAIWMTSAGQFAIEYDVGSYSAQQLTIKLGIFEATFACQIWGSPLNKRCDRLRAFLSRSNGNAEVYHTPWF